MNTHPHIASLRSFASRHDTQSSDIAAHIQDHLTRCDRCGELVAEMRKLHLAMLEVDELRIREETAHIMSRINDARKPRTIQLHAPNPVEDAEQCTTFTLAAKSDDTSIECQTIATLYSDDGHTLLRILHEEDAKEFSFQLLSEYTDHIPHALLHAPGIEPMMTDVEGSFRIADSEIDIVQIVSVSISYAFEHLRVGHMEAQQLDSGTGMLLSSEDYSLHVRNTGSQLETFMRWHGDPSSRPRYIGIAAPDCQLAGELNDNRAILPITALPEHAVILLY
ncbi:MAG: hypothetical protein KFH87_14970 [Bacteroidetes bacterium]|nr:hypothetical protein [Bacteroidota bacterium]